MKITFSARHFEATEKLQDFAKKEFESIRKFGDEPLSGEIILEERKNQKIVDLRLTAYGKILVSNLEGPDFYKAIPKAVEKLEKQLRALKSKINTRN